MAVREFAPGLPDPTRFGRVTDLPLNVPLEWVIQEHRTRRKGMKPHLDIRFGRDGRTGKPTLFSWAAQRFPGKPGEKRMGYRQPLHRGAYASFEGDILSGYGAGTVRRKERGKILVTSVSPDKIKFVKISGKHPEMFVMVRRSGPPADPKTARQARTQGGSWLIINTTPVKALEHNKVRYTKVPAKDVHKLFDKDYLVTAKLDGAAALYQLFSDRIEAISYRPTTKGRPIIHTYRVGGLTGVNIPKRLVGTILRGELYGVRKPTGEAIPPQELGGILNASTLKAIQKKQEQKVELRSAIFNILRYGKTDIPVTAPLAERMKKLKEVMKFLPKDKFHLPRMAETPEEQKKLWEEIAGGKYPLTHEGIVAWPRKGGRPTKVKLYKEHDVYVTNIFPGAGRLQGIGAGGFRYSLKPGGKEVGKVGTGFSEETRRRMLKHPEEFIGRIARLKAQEQFPGGAYRAPVFLALHEDYPAIKVAGYREEALRREMKGEDVPRLYLDPEDLSMRFSPAYAGYSTPGQVALNPYLQNWMTENPEYAEHIRRRGVIMTGPEAPEGAFAHELGHATGLGRSRLYGHLMTALRFRTKGGEILPRLGIPAGITAGILAGRKWGGKRGAALGAAVALLAHGPRLFEETRANLRARKALKEVGLATPAAMKALWGSEKAYVLPALKSVGWSAGVSLPFGVLLKGGSDGMEPGILTDMIRQTVEAFGGKGDTLADLAKVAGLPPELKDDIPMPRLSPELQRELGIAPKAKLGERLRAFMLGMKPEELGNLRTGLRGISKAIGAIRSLSDRLKGRQLPPTGQDMFSQPRI